MSKLAWATWRAHNILMRVLLKMLHLPAPHHGDAPHGLVLLSWSTTTSTSSPLLLLLWRTMAPDLKRMPADLKCSMASVHSLLLLVEVNFSIIQTKSAKRIDNEAFDECDEIVRWSTDKAPARNRDTCYWPGRRLWWYYRQVQIISNQCYPFPWFFQKCFTGFITLQT